MIQEAIESGVRIKYDRDDPYSLLSSISIRYTKDDPESFISKGMKLDL